MTYTRTTWVDSPATSSPISAANLNNIETALVSLLGTAPITNGALVWDGTKFTAAALIKDAQIDAAAAISYSKLNLASSITSADIVNGTIVDGDVSSSAAIALSKLASKLLLPDNQTQQYHIQFKSDTATADASGIAAFTYPTAFTTQTDVVIAINGDSGATTNAFSIKNSTVSASGFSIAGAPSLGPVRVNWIAVGH